MHAKTDSEVTSLAPSSPRRPVYYVQSPSRDSHDGDNKTATSFHSSPAASPPHSSAHHSHNSSSTRFSAPLKNKVSPADPNHKAPFHHHPIEEEGLLDDDDDLHGVPRRCYYLAFLLGFFLLFSFFSLVLWGASRNQKPWINMKSVTFSTLNVQAGVDASGVPTDMVDVNSTVSFAFRNTATFFGLHVTSSPIDLRYSELSLATGNMNYFYQRRKSQRNVNVVVRGTRVPLYGSGSYLSSTPGSATSKQQVPLTLNFTVRSRAYVLGRLVKPKFYINVECSVPLDLTKLTKPIPLKNHCQFN